MFYSALMDMCLMHYHLSSEPPTYFEPGKWPIDMEPHDAVRHHLSALKPAIVPVVWPQTTVPLIVDPVTPLYYFKAKIKPDTAGGYKVVSAFYGQNRNRLELY